MHAELIEYTDNTGGVVRRDLVFRGGYRRVFFEEKFCRCFQEGYGVVLHLEDRLVVTNVTLSLKVLERCGVSVSKKTRKRK